MPPYEIVDHTADTGIRVVAPDIEEFFADAACGMFDIIVGGEIEGWPATHEISLESPDIESLIVDWLSELLYLFDVKKFIFSKAQFNELTHNSLRCTARGTSFSGTIVGTEVKAVTHHLLEVRHTTAGYEATIIFDL